MKWSELDLEEKQAVLLNVRKHVKFPLYIIEKDWFVRELMEYPKYMIEFLHIKQRGDRNFLV